MALNGRRDLALAPSPRAGFEMTVLRMLAFRPGAGGAGSGTGNREPGAGAGQGGEVRGPKAAREALFESSAAPTRAPPPMRSAPPKPEAMTAPTPPREPQRSVEPERRVEPERSVEPERRVEPERSVEPERRETPATAASTTASTTTLDATSWTDLVGTLPLGGPAKELAAHAGFLGYDAGVLRLSLSPEDDHFKAAGLVKRLADALAPHLGGAPQIRFEAETARGETLHQRNTRERDARQVAAEQAFLADPDVQRLMQRHGATVVPDSIRPVDDA
jgi:DNA polymerase-3 subunit gamma/tau